jgi:hypothetical protein
MFKNLLATTALGAVLATGAFAQTETADPAADPAAPAANEAVPAEVMEGTDVTTDEAAPVEEPTMAEDPAPTDAPEVAEDPAPDANAPEVADGAAPDAEPVMAVAIPEGWVEVDPTTVSAETLIGADIKTYDGEKVASVDDVLLTDDGKVENVAATFGGFLGFGSDTVLLSMEELDIIKDANDAIEVRTTLTPESLEGRAPFEG